MANDVFAKLDLSEWQSGLAALATTGRESLARRMATAGGRVLRDEAKQLAPVSTPPYNPNNPSPSGSRHSEHPGTLRDAIYLAFDEERSTLTQFTYKVSWNNAKAWWGRLSEFGWVQKYAAGMSLQGGYFYSKKPMLAPDKWIRHPAQSFLRPAYESKLSEVKTVMLEVGRVELPKIIQEIR